MSASGASASEYFGGMADAYDSLIRRAVPRYAEMTERLVSHLPARTGQVLELGCGSGTLSLRLAERYPGAWHHFVDASAEMVERTRARLEGGFPETAARARFVVSRFEDLDLPGEAFDLIASSISLHHVEGKAALFARLSHALRPGGRLCIADQMRGASEETHRLHWARWLEFCRLPGHCDEEEIASLLEHAEAHDHYVPVGEHLEMLAAAGLVEADCLWRDGMWAVVTAAKPGLAPRPGTSH